jgi:hypothetical protein
MPAACCCCNSNVLAARVAATSCQIIIRPVLSPAASFAPSGLIATQVIALVWCKAKGGEEPKESGAQTKIVCRSCVAMRLPLAERVNGLGFDSLIRDSRAAPFERSKAKARPACASLQEQVRIAVEWDLPTMTMLSIGWLMTSHDWIRVPD